MHKNHRVDNGDMCCADELMQSAVRKKVFPGGSLLVACETSVLFYRVYGTANIFTGRPVTKQTLFDLASLTKPLATTLAVVKLMEKGEITLDLPITAILPGLTGTSKERITIRHLLTHQAGLPAHRPYYEALVRLPPDKRKKKLRELIIREKLIYPVGKKPVYSDLGFMILNWIVEKISGEPLDSVVTRQIYRHLGLRELFFPVSGVPSGQHVFAATEYCPWRNFLLEGVVHDDNAYAVGGVEGHAGLFGTAGDVHRLLAELLLTYHGRSRNDIFPRSLLQLFFRRQADAGRALGFDSPSVPVSSCGRYFSENTVGHLGFTGTSFWMDLDRRVIVVLLTNRVHPTRDNFQIRAFRPRLHNAVMSGLGIIPDRQFT